MHDELLDRLSSFASLEYLEIDEGGKILRANASFARHVGVPTVDLPGRSVREFLVSTDADHVLAWAAGTAVAGDDLHLVNVVTRTNEPYTLRCIVEPSAAGLVLLGEERGDDDHEAATQLLHVNNQFATLSRELTRKSRELERLNRELSRTLDDLRTSYWHLQKIQEVLPVCMSCGQVKGDGAKWEPVVDYLKTNDIFVSHGYCPACFDRLMTEMDQEEGL